MTDLQSKFTLTPIGFIDTPFSQKFGIPRQSHALSLAKGQICFTKHINVANACRGLEAFSHLWLSFIFHEHIDKPWSDTVRPPRLGGNERVGVFASRATHRPNPIGLSLVKNEGLNEKNQLIVSGVDLLCGTPIVDIKPYLDYSDTALDAQCAYANQAPDKSKKVVFDHSLQSQLTQILASHSDFKQLCESVLSFDPRPAYKQSLAQDDKSYSLRLYNIDIQWKVIQETIHVFALKHV